ncbi:MAG: hypothetical protein GXZ18_00930 [Synergistaceae bacterium]|nr:hypothetical protein [Synergistaceae bacterium]
MSKGGKALLKAFILIIVLIAATKSDAAAKTFVVSKKIDVSEGRILTMQFNGLKSSDTEPGGYSSIKIYEGKNKLLQTINIADVNSFGDDTTTCPDPGTGSDIIIEDMDFDGIKDFRIIAMLPPGPNIPYICFLWDKKSGKFIHAEFLDDITSPVFDSKKKTITSESRDNASTYSKEVYKYTGGKPLLIEEVVTEYKELKDANGKLRTYEIKTTKKLIDGKMKVIKVEKSAT